MTGRMHDALSKTLDTYDERRRVDLAREQKTRDEDARFLAGFAEVRRKLARPVFEEAGALLVERGHGFSISEQEFSAGTAGSVVEAGISLNIQPAGAPVVHDDHARTLSLTTRHYNKTVWIHGGRSMDSGGVAGSKGAYALEKIDRELIEDEVMRLVSSVMAT